MSSYSVCLFWHVWLSQSKKPHLPTDELAHAREKGSPFLCSRKEYPHRLIGTIRSDHWCHSQYNSQTSNDGSILHDPDALPAQSGLWIIDIACRVLSGGTGASWITSSWETQHKNLTTSPLGPNMQSTCLPARFQIWAKSACNFSVDRLFSNSKSPWHRGKKQITPA